VTLSHVSASQIMKYLRCPRQWWYRYAQGVEEPSTPAQEFGTFAHAALEGAIKTGRPCNVEDMLAHLEERLRFKDRLTNDAHLANTVAVGEAARRELVRQGILDTSHYALASEQPTDGITFAGVKLKGFIDLLAYDGQAERAIVADLKTASSWSWVPDSSRLSTNVQVMIYAHFALMIWSHLDEVTVAHVTVHKGTHIARWTPVTVSREHVQTQVALIIQAVERMKTTALLTDASAVEYNDGECQSFGGCPHRSRCPLHVTDRTITLEPTMSTMSPAERLRARIAAARSEAPVAPAPSPVVAAPAPVKALPPTGILPPDAEPPAPPSVVAVMRANARTANDLPIEQLGDHKGVTPTKLAQLRDYGIVTLGDLQAWREDHRLTEIKGWGEVAEQAVVDAIAAVVAGADKTLVKVDPAAAPAPAPSGMMTVMEDPASPEALRRSFGAMRDTLTAVLPDGRHKSIALTHLETAMLFALEAVHG